MASLPMPCANCDTDGTNCGNPGKSSCKNCRLVLYCGPDCQKSHWPIHKVHCKSALSKVGWTPNWVLENRTPTFIRGGIGVAFGGKKFLWGNVPALDVLQLSSNEGDHYQGQLSLLFAASGDLRNLVMTMTRLPASYTQPITVFINDRDLDIVARNTVMLLVALTAEAHEDTVDCMIHIWYSAFIRESDLQVLNKRVRPLVEAICLRIKDKPSNSVLGKTWTFGQRSLRLVLEKGSWDRLLTFLEVPSGLTPEKANRIRTAVTLADSRVDYRDRSFLFLPSSHRVARYRFRQSGILLPFGASHQDFQHPNPTFFQTADSWPMHDNADPLNGWSVGQIEVTSTGLATSDIYGKLYYYLRAMLKVFLDRVSTTNLSFVLLQLDASELPGQFQDCSFDRIEVSNISDKGYLGIHETVGIMSPLLQAPSVNPHATLITLFMNLVDESMTKQDQMAEATMGSLSTKRLLQFIPPERPPTSHHDPDIIKFAYARDFVRNYDHIFDRVAKLFRFSEFPQYIGATMKPKHTIVEEWPYRLKLDAKQNGAKEEFDLMMRGGANGKERYMEWSRV
ncbi:hypothetical protein FHETE_7119 [Fusarium heterosporum]|uniref:MYND-type domain-containing protein n=1 Tax=Fusarium heterosporum TaxID=42747 RepID=A0A8H5T750_FUSHE|nr:hypothetical protein FHETE_7119 [Fusarium heterosporum]